MASSMGADAGRPSLGGNDKNDSQCLSKPNAADVEGTPVNIAARTLPSRAMSPIVVNPLGSRAPGSTRARARGGRPVSSEATEAFARVAAPRCSPNTVPICTRCFKFGA